MSDLSTKQQRQKETKNNYQNQFNGTYFSTNNPPLGHFSQISPMTPLHYTQLHNPFTQIPQYSSFPNFHQIPQFYPRQSSTPFHQMYNYPTILPLKSQIPIETPNTNTNTNTNLNTNTNENSILKKSKEEELNQAIEYFNQVKKYFKNQPENFSKFKELMRDFKDEKIPTKIMVTKIMTMFQGNYDLVLKFNIFLPPSDQFRSSQKNGTTINENKMIGYVNKIKQRFSLNSKPYRDFLDILQRFDKNNSLQEICNEVSELFTEHHDLLEEFIQFLPETNKTVLKNGKLMILEEKEKQGKKNLRKRNYPYENNQKQNNLEIEQITPLTFQKNTYQNNEYRSQIPKKYKKRLYEKEKKKKKKKTRTEKINNNNNNNNYISNHNSQLKFLKNLKSKISQKSFERINLIIDLFKQNNINKTEALESIENILWDSKHKNLLLNLKNILFNNQSPPIQLMKNKKLQKKHYIQDGTKSNTSYFKIQNNDKNSTNLNNNNINHDMEIEKEKEKEGKGEKEKKSKKEKESGKEKEGEKESGKEKENKNKKTKILNKKYKCLPPSKEISLLNNNDQNNEYQTKQNLLEDQRYELDHLILRYSRTFNILQEYIKKLKLIPQNEIVTFNVENLFYDQLFLKDIIDLYHNQSRFIFEGLRINPPVTVHLLYIRFKKRLEEIKKSKLKFEFLRNQVLENNIKKYLTQQSNNYQLLNKQILTKNFMFNEINFENETNCIDFVGFNKYCDNISLLDFIFDLLFKSTFNIKDNNNKRRNDNDKEAGNQIIKEIQKENGIEIENTTGKESEKEKEKEKENENEIEKEKEKEIEIELEKEMDIKENQNKKKLNLEKKQEKNYFFKNKEIIKKKYNQRIDQNPLVLDFLKNFLYNFFFIWDNRKPNKHKSKINQKNKTPQIILNESKMNYLESIKKKNKKFFTRKEKLFYGNQHFYRLFKLFFLFYQRLLTAKNYLNQKKNTKNLNNDILKKHGKNLNINININNNYNSNNKGVNNKKNINNNTTNNNNKKNIKNISNDNNNHNHNNNVNNNDNFDFFFRFYQEILKRYLDNKIKKQKYIKICHYFFGNYSYQFLGLKKIIKSILNVCFEIINKKDLYFYIELFQHEKNTNKKFNDLKYLINLKNFRLKNDQLFRFVINNNQFSINNVKFQNSNQIIKQSKEKNGTHLHDSQLKQNTLNNNNNNNNNLPIHFSVKLLENDEINEINKEYKQYFERKTKHLSRFINLNKTNERSESAYIRKNNIFLSRNKRYCLNLFINQTKKLTQNDNINKNFQSINPNHSLQKRQNQELLKNIYKNVRIQNNLCFKFDQLKRQLIFVQGSEDLLYRKIIKNKNNID
ncbi:sin3b-related [Anaeramoeba flamelloides]|uniref:Sin3b-related n=1 Tax=Anaeramoeba flamelloides TaxID=1746091 RepID=A0AAV7ZSQ5_9EUKA|nr:sin3b-related [Anaeramoeba flamelloides]